MTLTMDHAQTLLRETGKEARLDSAAALPEAALRRVLSCAQIGLFVWDEQANCPLHYSEEYAALAGLPVDELIAREKHYDATLDIIEADDIERYDRTVLQAIDSRTTYDVEYRVRTYDGRRRHWREIGEPVIDEDGTLIKTFGMVQDITDLRATGHGNNDDEARFRNLAEGSIQGVHIHINETPVFANRTLVDIFGYDNPEEILALPSIMALAAPQERARLSAMADARVRGEAVPGRYEFQGVRRDGTLIWLEIVSILIEWRGQTAIQSTLVDITQRKRAEEQLLQAQKMEAIGQLTGGIAHDFNNLLAIILGKTELLKMGKGDADTHTDAILRAGRRGAELTQHLLSFARQQPLRPVPTDVNALILQAKDLLVRTSGETIDLQIDTEPVLNRVLVDPGQLEMALLNLVINAQQAMPQGGKLSIQTANVVCEEDAPRDQVEAALGECVLISVSDNGTGMTEAVVQRAFEPFFTTKDVGQGSGLGLSMVHGFAKQSDGDVFIDSVLGEGTNVRLYLPRAPFHDAPVIEKPQEVLPTGVETILVVEDEPDVRSIAVDLLSSLGYTMLAAEDGGAALNVIHHDPSVDLLLSDVVLPDGMNGPALAALAREFRPDISVLFMSGFALQKVDRATLPVDAALVGKPLDHGILAREVRTALDQRPRQ